MKKRSLLYVLLATPAACLAACYSIVVPVGGWVTISQVPAVGECAVVRTETRTAPECQSSEYEYNGCKTGSSKIPLTKVTCTRWSGRTVETFSNEVFDKVADAPCPPPVG
jgi:hypothetical protein